MSKSGGKEEGDAMRDYEASKYYDVVIPASYAKPIEISLEPTGDVSEEVFLYVSTEALSGCGDNNISRGVRIIPAILKDGKYVSTIEPSEESIPSDENATITVGLVKGYMSSESGTKSIGYEKKCRVVTPIGNYEENAAISEFAEKAYKYIESLGYSFEPRTKQIEINCIPLNVHGYYYSSKLGINYSNIELNINEIYDLPEMKRTVIHEMMHLVNAIYDPRYYFTKAIIKSDMLWMDEAIAVWAEEFLDGKVSPIQQLNFQFPLQGFSPIYDYDIANHGYGMAALIKYIAMTYGDNSIVKLAQQLKAGKKTPFDCFDSAFPDLFSSYHKFLSNYVEEKIYPFPSGESPFISYAIKKTINSTDPFTIDLSLSPYSVQFTKFSLNYSDISNKRIKITTEGSLLTFALYKSNSTTNKVEYIGIINDEYIYNNLSDIKAGEGLFVVVYNDFTNSKKEAKVTAVLEEKEDESNFTMCEVQFRINDVEGIFYTSTQREILSDVKFAIYGESEGEGTYTKSGDYMIYKETINKTSKSSVEFKIDPSSNTIVEGTVYYEVYTFQNAQEIYEVSLKNIPLTDNEQSKQRFYASGENSTRENNIIKVSKTINYDNGNKAVWDKLENSGSWHVDITLK